MPGPAFCCIITDRGGHAGTYKLAPHHYEEIQQSLDHGEMGWREFELFEHPSGRALIRVDSIIEVFLASEAWIEASDELEQENHAYNQTHGLD